MRYLWPLCLILSFVPCLAFAQPQDTLWTRVFGEENPDFGWSVAAAPDGGCVVAGSYYPIGQSQHGYIARLDRQGDTLWTRCYDNFGSASHITALGIDGFVLDAGWDLAKISATGDVVWTVGLGGYQTRHSYCATVEAELILITFSDSLGTALVKLSSSADTLWIHHYSQPISGARADICQTTDGGFVAVVYDPDSLSRMLWKFDATGDSLWTRSVEGPDTVNYTSIVATVDSGVVLCGNRAPSGVRALNVGLLRLDALGDTLWSHSYGAADAREVTAIMNEGEGFVFAGTADSDTGAAENLDCWLSGVSASGDLLWERTYGSSYTEATWAMARSTEGAYYLTGCRLQSSWDIFVMALEADSVIGSAAEPIAGRAFDLDLEQNYPNPFNATTQIRYSLPREGHVSLRVFDVTGREVETLIDDVRSAGENTIEFAAGELPSGVYFARIDAAGMSQTRKMVLLK